MGGTEGGRMEGRGVWMVGGWEGGWCGDGGKMEGRGVGMVGGWRVGVWGWEVRWVMW